MATGELNGMSESVTARVEPGSFNIANMLMNDSTSIHATGCCAWRASCSVDDMAPTAANIAEYKKKPPRKYAMKTANVAPVTCGTWNSSSAAPTSPAPRGVRRASSRRPATPQMRNWKMDTAPTPRTLPSSSWKGRSDDTSTSTTRDVFSSSTELMTLMPYNRIAEYKMIPMK